MGEVTAFPIPGSGSALTAPIKLDGSHDLSGFDCGAPALSDWLRKRAWKNQLEQASRTYVVCHGGVVVGYYCIANGSVLHSEATSKIRRNMPDPVPAMVLGRLAVDRRWHGQGIGAGMLRDALLRTLQVADISGCRALLVHAKDEAAKRFYLAHDFKVSPIQPLTLMLSVTEIGDALR